MTTESRFDSVGWVFFGIAWLLFLGPSVYGIYNFTIDSTPVSLRLGAAFFLAGFCAAILSWIANSLLGYIADRRQESANPAAQKGKPASSED